MSIIRKSGKPNIEYFPNTTSQAYANNTLQYFDLSGAVIPADATSGNHAGVILETITSSDDKYTTAGMVPVDIYDDNDIFEATVTGTLTAAMIGGFYDLSTAAIVDVGNQSKNVVLCVGFISATKGLFKLNARATVVNVATT